MSRHSFPFAAAAAEVARVIFIVCSILILGCFEAQGQTASPGPLGRPVPDPRSVLGFVPGSERTIADWRQITGYFAQLDRASDRVQVQQLGLTTLGNPFIAVFISAPENIHELDNFKMIQRSLADPRKVRDEADRDKLIAEGKTVVAISCSIHSTEIVASQMSMQLAYELATATDQESRDILRNTILILLPSTNPDGVNIVADWYRKTLGTPFEGTNPPELYHSYAGHDNNRDWFMINLRETRIVSRLFWNDWFPQIVYDIHQQSKVGPRLFVPPFHEPSNPNIQPLLLREVDVLGSKIAANLEAANMPGVITNAIYDTWWHGGFRTAPYFHNSIGILSEAASANLMTPVRVTEAELARETRRGMRSALEPATNYPRPWRGGIWGPREIMDMEMSASRSVLSLASKYRAQYLRNFYDLSRSSVSKNSPPNQPLAYLIPAGQGRDEAVARLVQILLDQGVEVFRMDHELHMSMQGSGGMPIEVPLGSYLVFMAQPARWNVQALFERQTYPDRRTAGGEAEPPYDVAGWTLPMQMGVETNYIFAIAEAPNEAKALTMVRDGREVRKALGLALPLGVTNGIANPVTRQVRLGVYRSWVADEDEGWTRWLFDTFHVPYETLRDKEMRAGALREKFDVIILPSQSADQIARGNLARVYPQEFAGGITDAGVENLRNFVQEGGTLICFDESSELAIKRFDLPVKNVVANLKRSVFYCPGSILQLEVDTTSPLARGLGKNVDAYFINSSAFESTDNDRVRSIAKYAARNTLRSGWLLGEERIAGRIALADVTMGKGHVLLFGFRPQHRGQTWATFPFIFNAIMSGAPKEM